MGDARFNGPLRRLTGASDLGAEIGRSRDDELIQALAGASKEPYLANVVASELMNRLRRKSAILAVAGEGLIVLDPAGRVTFLNPAAKRILGLDAHAPGALHELVHAHARNALGAPDAAPHCPFLLALRSRTSIRVEEDVFLTRDARKLPVSYTVSPIKRDGEIEGFVVVFRDATQARRLLQSFERSERKLQDAQRLAGLGRWEWDAERDALAWSEETHRIFGVAPDAFGGELDDLLARVADADRAAVQAAFAETGRAIAAEWAKDNAVRRVSTDDLKSWGKSFSDAAGDAKRLLAALGNVRETVAKRAG